MNDKHNTPHGLFDHTVPIEQYQEFAGVKYSEKDQSYSILREKVTCPKWKKDINTGRRIEIVGEHRINITIRFYNFIIAQKKTGGSFFNAINWLKKYGFNQGKPVYLPEQEGHKSYLSLLRELGKQ